MAIRIPLAGLLVLLVCLPAAARDRSGSEPDAVAWSVGTWSLGPYLATYAGPTHDDLLAYTNRIMAVNQSDPDRRFEDLPTGVPAGLRLWWKAGSLLAFSATYGFSRYSTEATFTPFEWESRREMAVNLHELTVAVHHSLAFLRGSAADPYVGVGVNVYVADSEYTIGLRNVYGVTEDGDVMSDHDVAMSSMDWTAGPVALAGITYHLSPRVAVNGEFQGLMGQVRQHFDYEGSLPYIVPNYNPDDPLKVNDVLQGAYPMDLNGIRLSVSLLISL